jgi:predicted RNA binding protein YcfA (HicA-like mRNA interferase family)
MPQFPVDAPIKKVMKALETLDFKVIREGNHISMLKEDPDGTRTPLTIPNHLTIKKSTLRTILTQARIPRDEFLKAYYS